MKLLIVDDERHVREAIKLLIDWEKFMFSSISEATDGEQAIQLLKTNHYDIVLTDMLMPTIGGIQLLEWIHNHYPQCKTIVISGYDDFTYVRYTMKYGGQDYILKPIDEQQLNEALEKAIATRKNEMLQQFLSHEHNKKLNMMRPHYWNKIFSSVIESGSLPASIEQDMMLEFSLEKPITQAIVSLISMTTVYHETLKRFNYNTDLLSFSLANIANEYLGQNIGYACANWNNTQDVMIILWQNTEKVADILMQINNGIEATFGHKCDVVVGTLEAFPTHLKQSLKNSLDVMDHYNLLQSSNRVHRFNSYTPLREQSIKFDKYQEHIRLALLSGKHHTIENQLDEWFKQLEKLNYMSLHQLKLWIQTMTLFEAKCFENEPNAKPSIAMQQTTFSIPFHANGQPDFKQWKKKLLSLLSMYATFLSQSTKSISISDEIADYINNNYNQDVSLQTIADCFLLSREYISRKFKQDMNENISDYIAKIRLSHAKQLLANPNLKLVQIAELVGFTDEKYFSKVFKKVEGISPNQYRKEQLILDLSVK